VRCAVGFARTDENHFCSALLSRVAAAFDDAYL
jgi:hypothetical protein